MSATREERKEAAERARTLAFTHLLAFVRDARAKGWDPSAFLPRIAWQLDNAVAQASVFDELTRNHTPDGE